MGVVRSQVIIYAGVQVQYFLLPVGIALITALSVVPEGVVEGRIKYAESLRWALVPVRNDPEAPAWM